MSLAPCNTCPSNDDAGTDTGSHGNEYGTVTFFGGTLPHLSIHIAGTVAVDVYLDARRRYTAQLLIEGVVVPARYVGGPYPVGLGVNDTGDADTYSVDCIRLLRATVRSLARISAASLPTSCPFFLSGAVCG